MIVSVVGCVIIFERLILLRERNCCIGEEFMRITGNKEILFERFGLKKN